MKKKIYLYLCGGLGNQLFQYAAAKNIAIINDADLIIDTQCGFITDFRDFWKFSLSVSNLKNVILKKNILVFGYTVFTKKFLVFVKFLIFSFLEI